MIVQAIITKYIGPSNVRGSRVRATAAAGSVIVAWDHRYNHETNHARAALKLAAKLQWDGKYLAGGLPKDSGYAFVNAGNGQGLDPEFEVRGAMLYLRGVRVEA